MSMASSEQRKIAVMISYVQCGTDAHTQTRVDEDDDDNGGDDDDVKR